MNELFDVYPWWESDYDSDLNHGETDHHHTDNVIQMYRRGEISKAKAAYALDRTVTDFLYLESIWGDKS